MWSYAAKLSGLLLSWSYENDIIYLTNIIERQNIHSIYIKAYSYRESFICKAAMQSNRASGKKMRHAAQTKDMWLLRTVANIAKRLYRISAKPIIISFRSY